MHVHCRPPTFCLVLACKVGGGDIDVTLVGFCGMYLQSIDFCHPSMYHRTSNFFGDAILLSRAPPMRTA